jgi:ribosomal protein S13
MDNELAGQCRLLLATVVSLVADEVMKRVEVVLDAHVHELDEDRVRALAEQQASAMFIDDRGDGLPRAWTKEALLAMMAGQPALDHKFVRQPWSKQQIEEMIMDRAWTQQQIDDMVNQKITDMCVVDEDRVQELIDENNLDEDRVREMIDEGFEELDDKIEEYLSNNLNDEVVTIVRDMDFKVTVR